jgi:hypothetical protein
MKNIKGFTLIETLITMVLVIGVLMVTSVAFKTILNNTSRVISSEESNIEGVVGLEMFRRDLQLAGFGLFDSISNYDSSIAYYTEASVAPANGLNDNTLASRHIPRAFVSFDNMPGGSDTQSDATTSYNMLPGTDYLGIKATNIGRSKAAQKWTYINYSSFNDAPQDKTPSIWPSAADNLKATDTAIVIMRSFSLAGLVSNTLITPTVNPQIYWLSNPTAIITTTSVNYPANLTQVNYIYGVDDAAALGMPFNRADYFVARPSNSTKIPSVCAPNTGILYRTNVNHVGGKLTYMPLLDCVADMQVVFGWDMGNGVITESSASGASTPAAIADIIADPAEIRNKLKYVKVYLMVQDGRNDSNYLNKNTLGPGNNTYSVVVGEPGANPPSNVNITKAYTANELTAKGWLNYRWKIYRIVVRPKNLTN